MPGVQFVAAKPAEIQKAAGIATWPTDLGQIDLGNRIVDVIPIPGHDVASIALYDRVTGNLMTGDSLYPGRLYVGEAQIPTYAASAQRMVDFVRLHPIAHVLGTHIEQGSQSYFDYPRDTTYQPKEHVLELSRAHVFELNEAFKKMDGKPINDGLSGFRGGPASGEGVKQPENIQAGDGLGLQPGVVPTGWRTGGPNCVTVPSWQVKEYNEDFYILRESGCINPEKPFLFLIFGENKALLEDTGVAMLMPDFTRGTVIPTAPVIQDLMAKWAAKKKHAPVSLVVIHSHGHNDHTAGDEQLKTIAEHGVHRSQTRGDFEAHRYRQLAQRHRPHRFGRTHRRRDSVRRPPGSEHRFVRPVDWQSDDRRQFVSRTSRGRGSAEIHRECAAAG